MAITRFSGSNITTGNKKYASFDTGYPTIMAAPTATDGGTGTTASVAFTAQTGATSYTVLSSPGSLTGSGASSPITVSGLTAGTAYTFQVRAINSVGAGPYSDPSNSITPVAPAFESIATATPTTGVSVTISSIPSTFKHLQVRGLILQQSGAPAFSGFQFNGDTGNNYGEHWAYSTAGATGVGVSSPRTQIDGDIYGGGAANCPFVFILDILDYANTSKFKTTRLFFGQDPNASGGSVQINSGLWRSTSAINSITFIGSGSVNFAAGTSFAVYGIKEAS